MAGANASSLVGSGYVVDHLSEPLITVVAHGNEFHVCQRSARNDKYKTIIACFFERSHAETFGSWLTIDSAQPLPRAPTARSPIIQAGKAATRARKRS